MGKQREDSHEARVLIEWRPVARKQGPAGYATATSVSQGTKSELRANASLEENKSPNVATQCELIATSSAVYCHGAFVFFLFVLLWRNINHLKLAEELFSLPQHSLEVSTYFLPSKRTPTTEY